MTSPCDYLVVGGGFFGTYLSCLLRQRHPHASVVVVERERTILKRASYSNQARIHQGYHYPRSFITAFSSRRNFDLFVREFPDCVVNDFSAYYAIGRIQSHITASQFRAFCKHIGAPIEAAPFHVKALFNPVLIEDVFLVKEYAFNADILRELMIQKLAEYGVQVLCGHDAVAIRDTGTAGSRDGLETQVVDGSTGASTVVRSREVFVCTYSNLNTILIESGIAPLDLKHELTEMPLVNIPGELTGMAVTIMCGPFFSIMPFPARGVHSIHHVRYTPHCQWHDGDRAAARDGHGQVEMRSRPSRFKTIIKDVARYIPCMAAANHVDSIWEVKTILPRNERDDGRPILIQPNVGRINNLTCVLGGKLDNIYDIADRMGALQ